MNDKEYISEQNYFNTANELPHWAREIKLQCTTVLYSVKLLTRRGNLMTLQYDHPSRGPHIASCAQHFRSPFSADLTSYGFFLSRYLKSKVYLSGVLALMTKDNILRTVLSIPGDNLLSVVDNVVYRMQCVVQEKGGHIKRCLLLWCIVISFL
ncbi:hypothetical protein AVEN_227047-1 [Araneus ventricosus]|uniref:Uncharacterized protein n=1 Tax=Araneus ventricosus TaxID=182803 RepID=A0A4Y2ST38_ARAVE|nr:hypothetical protein AVEN_227047-1 [Araneus ventricosus]